MKRILFSIAAGLGLAACQTAEPPNRFDEADVNADGKLTRKEVSDYMVTSIFVTRDTNKDKIMTRAEWNLEGDKEAEKIFAQRDLNKDGVVSLEEAMAYAQKAGTWNAVIKETDTDKDGCVSREEAAAYYAKHE